MKNLWKTFWKPQFKWQLVDWFVSSSIMERSKAERMTKNQLYGKYWEIRSKE